MKFLSFLFLSSLTSLSLIGKSISEKEAWKLGWPTMQGPYGNYQVPQTGTKLVDDLSEAKLLWESETRDFGRAKHTTGSFKGKTPQDRAQKIRDILQVMASCRFIAEPLPVSEVTAHRHMRKKSVLLENVPDATAFRGHVYTLIGIEKDVVTNFDSTGSGRCQASN